MTDPELTYGQALEELRAIHSRISAEDVDVETLVEDVKRAADLLRLCRERLDAVGESLEEVLTDFD